MRLKVWDLSKKGNDKIWFDEEVKEAGINEWNELYCLDQNENFHILCELRKGIDVYEIKEK